MQMSSAMNTKQKALIALFLVVLANMLGIFIYEGVDGHAAILGVSLVEMILTYTSLAYLVWVLCPIIFSSPLQPKREISLIIRLALTIFIMLFPFVDAVGLIFYQDPSPDNLFAPLLSDGYAIFAFSRIVILLLSTLMGFILALTIFKTIQALRMLN